MTGQEAPCLIGVGWHQPQSAADNLGQLRGSTHLGVHWRLGNRHGAEDISYFSVIIKGTAQTGHRLMTLVPSKRGHLSAAQAVQSRCGFGIHQLPLFGGQRPLEVDQSLFVAVGGQSPLPRQQRVAGQLVWTG